MIKEGAKWMNEEYGAKRSSQFSSLTHLFSDHVTDLKNSAVHNNNIASYIARDKVIAFTFHRLQ